MSPMVEGHGGVVALLRERSRATPRSHPFFTTATENSLLARATRRLREGVSSFLRNPPRIEPFLEPEDGICEINFTTDRGRRRAINFTTNNTSERRSRSAVLRVQLLPRFFPLGKAEIPCDRDDGIVSATSPDSQLAGGRLVLSRRRGNAVEVTPGLT